MQRRPRHFRLTAWLAATSLATATCLVGAPPLHAQDAGGDPPARVGRLARLSGNVSTHGAGATEWTPAVLNFPFTSGDSLWTPPQAQADIEIGAALVTLADQTELDVATLDERALVASEPQGALFLDLRDMQPGQTVTINTPRGAAQIAADGEYEILAGDANTPTRLVVVRGAAQLTAGALALRAGPGQMAVATGSDTVQGDVEPLTSYDPFLTAMLSRNSAPINEPQAVQGMTGAEGLAQYGSWQSSPDYGQVWYPQVSPDWVPYRDGSWSYVAPWGWTWVDNEPWGFAPFHYGRWAQIDQRWCWVPGQPGEPVDEEPAYAPALVDFLVAGAVAGAAGGLLYASLRSGRGDVGWVPLGPRESYAPPYGGSGRYLSRLNPGSGWHRPGWGGNSAGVDHGRNAFINRAGLTVVPAAAMAGSRPIRAVAHGFGSPAARGFQQADSVQPLRGALPIRPTPATRGLTPQVAHRFGLADTAPRAPGPAINPALAHPGVASAGRMGFRGPAATAAAPHPAPVARGLATPTQHAPMPIAHRFEPPRPSAPRIQTPRVEAPHPPAAPQQRVPRFDSVRPQAPPPAMFRPQAPRPEAPPIQTPRFQAPRPAEPQPMAQPRFEAPRQGAAPRPEAARPSGGARPEPHQGGRPDRPGG